MYILDILDYHVLKQISGKQTTSSFCLCSIVGYFQRPNCTQYIFRGKNTHKCFAVKDDFLRILWQSYAACWDGLHFTFSMGSTGLHQCAPSWRHTAIYSS